MARRHHTLPRFLLRGFASRAKLHATRRKRDRSYVWVFPRGGEPYETNIDNVGVVRDFHGGPSEPDVEGKLSREDEGRFAALLEELHAERVPEDRAALGVFVAHLVVRTAHMRASITDWGKAAYAILSEEITRDERFEEMWALARQTMAPEVLARLDCMSPPERKRILTETWATAAPAFQAVMRIQVEQVPEQVKSAQLRLLSGPLSIGRAQALGAFNWRVLEAAPGSLILGDLGPIGRFEGSDAFDAPIKHAEPDSIYLPLSPCRLLVGWREGPERSVDIEALNRASAALSRDYFVAFRCTARERDYVRLVGTRAAYMTPEEMRRAFRAGGTDSRG